MSESQAPDLSDLTISFLGGTGPQGRGLALRFAQAGLTVVLGSRTAPRAEEAAAALTSALDRTAGSSGGGSGSGGGGGSVGTIRGAANAEAAAAGDVVLVVIPWDGHADLLRSLASELAGKVVVDCVNPLGFDKQGAHALQVPEGSAAQQAAALLPDSRVVGAFHHVSAVLLEDPDVASVETDVLVLGDDREATDLVQALASVVPGMRGIYGGRLRNAHQVEALTANLISINRRHKTHAGVRVTGV